MFSLRGLVIAIAGLATLGEVNAAAVKNITSTAKSLGAITKKVACLDSTATDYTINLAFFYGGPGTTVNLCQNAVINLVNPIYFTAAKQTIQTIGKPSDSNRATLNVAANNFTTAFFGTCGDCAGLYVGYVIVNGNRPLFGFVAASDGGTALLEMGGNAGNQIIEHVWAYEPRGWSALHTIEGSDALGNPLCSGMVVRNNRIGPSGNSANQGPQFKRDLESYRLFSRASMKVRQATGVNPPGQWADGISLACKNSLVTGNTIVDATDGAIVIFGAPGSIITKNTIIASTRNLLGGINLVDYAPWRGSYTGTIVSGNIIQSNGAMIKNGIAVGTMVWGSYNTTDFRTYDGIIKNNVFSSSNGGYFGYGIAAAGHNNTNIVSNNFNGATFNGAKSEACIPDPFAPPPPQKTVFDPYTSWGLLQKGFTPNTLVFLICLAPTNADGATGWSKRSTIVASNEVEHIDTLVARTVSEDSQAEEATRVLARAIAEAGPHDPPAPRATATVTFNPPAYMKRAIEDFNMMGAVDKRSFATVA